MLIISFAWTTAALLATWPDGSDAKTCTRRNWNDGYAKLFKAGTYIQGWDRSPRYGGHKVAIIMVTQDGFRPWRLTILI